MGEGNYTMEHQDVVGGLLVSPGVEIGAFKTPIPGIAPIHVDRFQEYANEPTLADYRGDSADLPFLDSSLNYVATSHVIEHVANPLAAIMDWYRVLRNDGIIYMVVPDRRLTFDRARPLTPAEHMVDDYLNRTSQCDGTHIDEYVLNVDWRELSPGTTDQNVDSERESLRATYLNAVQSGSEINIHFHTFEASNMLELLVSANRVLPLKGGRIEVIRVEPAFPTSMPNGFLIVAQVKKPGPMPVFSDPTAILRPGAVKFERRAEAPRLLWNGEREAFPEQMYLRLNPDVAAAVEKDHFRSGYAHYESFGKKEGRRVQ
jgi:SAM-dependent methyltransferase